MLGKTILFNSLVCCLFVLKAKADYREDYQNAYMKLNQKLVENEIKVKPIEVKTITDFFYDVILYVYTQNTQNSILKRQCYKCLKKINDEKLIRKIANAIEEVYGAKGNSKHLSLYALRNKKNELIVIFRLCKCLSKTFQNSDIINIYENYKNDLWLDSML